MKVPKQIHNKSLKMCCFIGRSHLNMASFRWILCLSCFYLNGKMHKHTHHKHTAMWNYSLPKWGFNPFPTLFTLFSAHIAVIETQSWTIKVPSVVKGLPGSCVVIPCSYDFPTPKKPPTKYTGMWKDARDQFIYHPDQSKVKPAMRGRTRLTGSLIQKDCSLEINPLKLDDRGFFHFRISLTGYNSYSYVKNTVTISKIGTSSNVVFHLY